jgi:hypothetical protein
LAFVFRLVPEEGVARLGLGGFAIAFAARLRASALLKSRSSSCSSAPEAGSTPSSGTKYYQASESWLSYLVLTRGSNPHGLAPTGF